MPGSSSTNAPKSATRETLPVDARALRDIFRRASVHGSGASCFNPSAILRVSRLIFRILTSIDSPAVTTSRRLHAARIRHVGNVQQSVHAAQIDERAEIHQAADRPAHDRAFLQPRRRLLPWPASRALREPRAGRPPRLRMSVSSLVIRHSISWPTSFSISACSRAPLREAGMNARTPTSTRSPPLTTSSTVPPMVLLLANAASRPLQSRGVSTLMVERCNCLARRAREWRRATCRRASTCAADREEARRPFCGRYRRTRRPA